MTRWLLLLLLPAALAGCGDKPSAEAVGVEIRGTPIAQRAEKISTNRATASAPGATATKESASSSTGVVAVGFDKLGGYVFEVTDGLLGPITNDVALAAVKTDAMIPEAVRALNNRAVSVKGFMLPLKVEGGLVTELLIMKDQSMCCYGSTPKINEWVSVKMKSKGVRALMDQPVTLFGTLHVGETRENGYLVGIYRLDGERMEAPEE
jgi:hypothetical protein